MAGIKKNIVSTLPDTLEKGVELYLENSSGQLTKYVGNSNNEPVPAKGYYENVYMVQAFNPLGDGSISILETVQEEFGTLVITGAEYIQNFSFGSNFSKIYVESVFLNDNTNDTDYGALSYPIIWNVNKPNNSSVDLYINENFSGGEIFAIKFVIYP